MTLTDDNIMLLSFTECKIITVSELRQQAESLHSNSAEILSRKRTIGTILDPEFIRLGAFLQRLAESYPQLSTQLQHDMSGNELWEI